MNRALGYVLLLSFSLGFQGLYAQTPTYERTWDSLTQHPIPEWFEDAKFGIYAHLGPYCVPAHGSEWYPRNMYRKSKDASKEGLFERHQRVYGDQSKFGYKDFIPMFTMENFDAAAWAQLYKDAGARFAGPVAEHHDGFSMWPSKVNRWNASDMGPKRDIVGELVSEIRKRDMKVITSFHHSHNHNGDYFQPIDVDEAKAKRWDVFQPEYADLYGHYPDRKQSLDIWWGKLREVIDAYKPDQIWFDFGLKKIPDDYKQRFAAYYYNKEGEWDKPVIITRKGDHLPDGVGVLDIERGRMKGMGEQLWQTDDSTAYNSWSGVEGLQVKPTEEVLQVLIDIVSKNGVLLLNVCPSADGTISNDQQAMLRGIGDWLKINGEAIYATRPWEVFGEGPTRLQKGGGFLKTLMYTGQDIRYTRSKDGKSLYAICMGWPDAKLLLQSPLVTGKKADAEVTLLGHGKIPHRIVDDQIALHVPELKEQDRPCQHAYAFKLSGFEFALNPMTVLPTITLQADTAVLDGEKVQQQEKAGRTNIGYWDNATESAHWLMRVNEPGYYQVRAEAASANGTTALRVSVNHQNASISIAKSRSWDNPQWNDGEAIEFTEPGIYHVMLKPEDPSTWKAVNVWQLQFQPTKQ
ncbi:Alpha-L-fucosidase [Planctomycetes bacterium CA13]|uniref:alpha-L-fucosidase n=1 Tax=Novipirellula herctigrandis TaxID=2527986 RepID=A0A5C5ZCW0_9BACT|nr:Alpha-L-fucosidase [Planctomycetes bacterium CA13]